MAQGFFSKLIGFFGGRLKADSQDVDFSTSHYNEVHLMGLEIRAPNQGLPMRVTLGKKGKGKGRELYIYPDRGLESSDGMLSTCYRIFSPENYLGPEVGGFIRLEMGESLVVGRHDPAMERILGLPHAVAARHMTIANEGDALTFKDLDTDAGSYVGVMKKPADVQRLDNWRRDQLKTIRKIFGGPLEPLSPRDAKHVLEGVNDILEKEAYRPLDYREKPGGLINLPEEMTPIIIGDLHAQVDNLLKILTENNYLHTLEKGTSYLVILGDAIHSEVEGEMEDMTSSLLMMDLIFKLKLRFPKQVFYIRGNHDGFSERIIKSNIPQGQLWERAVRMERGAAYKEELDRFYDNLALMAISRDFVTCHAAPPKSLPNVDFLVDAHKYSGLAKELLWNRLQRANYPAGYNRGDVNRFRKALDLSSETQFIVSHNPLDQQESLWLNAGGIENHHIVFSGRPHCIGLFTRLGGKLTSVRYLAEPLLGLINALEE